MRTSVAVAILVVLMLTPLVMGAEISCKDHVKAPDMRLECRVLGQENDTIRLHLRAFNGIPVSSYVVATGHIPGWDGLISANPGNEYFLAPFNFSVNLENVMKDTAREAGLDGDHYWVFYNKENILTFDVVHKNGRVEKKNVTVYVSGKVPYPWEDKDAFGLLFSVGLDVAIIAGILVLVKLVGVLRTERAEEAPESREERPKPPELSRSSILWFVFFFFGLWWIISPWALYLLASPTKLTEDMGLFLLMGVPFGLTLEWLYFAKNAERSGYSHLIRRAPITGLEWTVLVLTFLGGWARFLGPVLFVFMFVLNQEPGIMRRMRKAALPVSLAVSLALVALLNVDTVLSLLFLSVAFIHPYLAASKGGCCTWVGEPLAGKGDPDVKELLEKFEGVIKAMELEGRG